jgi:hypothetical protein
MKKLIFILMAAAAFSCGDGSNRSSERGPDTETDNTEQVEPDTTGMESEAQGVESDTTSRQQSDSLNNK